MLLLKFSYIFMKSGCFFWTYEY